MGDIKSIPEVVHNFNAYKSGNKLIGLAGSITLPDFSATTSTISGAGILGEYDEAIIGTYGNMTLDVTFRVLDNDIFSLMNPLEPFELTFRGSVQVINPATAALDTKSMRIVVRGKQTDFKPGKMENGTTMDASVSINVIYILIEIDGKSKLELDKINFVYKIAGNDIMAKVRKQC